MTEMYQTEMPRKTKIIATLGPSTDSREMIAKLIDAGVDLVRMNFSHGDAAAHLRRAQLVREVSQKKRYHVGIIGDLQGPKIRIQRFVNDQVKLEVGRRFVLDAKLDQMAGSEERVGLTYPDLYKDIAQGDELLLDDGRIVLKVEQSKDGEIVTHVEVGGVLSNNKGINRRGGGLSALSITEKDKQDIKLAVQMGVDYLAVSFPKNAKDILYAKQLMEEAGGNAGIIAKIERGDALNAIEEILEASDGVMIARGDLSIEIGDATLTAVQKRLIAQARERDRIAITATEMLQSMIKSTVPTRAEISDVSNAVLDGSDALMLSAESAIGDHPDCVVQTMSRICQGAEQGDVEQHKISALENQQQVDRIDKAIALSTIYTAKHLNVVAIAALTESGSVTQWLSRFLSSIPIYALTPHVTTCRRVTLYRGVYPVLLSKEKTDDINVEVNNALKSYCTFEKGAIIMVTKGDKKGEHGGTNAMKIIHFN